MENSTRRTQRQRQQQRIATMAPPPSSRISPSSARRLATTSKLANAKDRRRSFALVMEQIPSFRRLNGDGLFDDDIGTSSKDTTDVNLDAKAFRRLSTTPKSRKATNNNSSLNASTHHSPRRRSGRRNSVQKKQLERLVCDNTEFIFEIPETQVTIQRVSDNDALFHSFQVQDSSTKTFATASTAATVSSHTRSSLDTMADDPFLSFASILSESCSALDFDDTDLFSNGYNNKNNNSSCGDLGFSTMEDADFFAAKTVIKSPTAKKYGKLSTKVLAAAAAAASSWDEVHFVPPSLNDPTELAPMSPTAKSRRVSVKSPTGRRRRSRSLSSQDDFRNNSTRTNQKAGNNKIEMPLQPPLYPVANPNETSLPSDITSSTHGKVAPRPRRRSSLGQSSSHHPKSKDLSPSSDGAPWSLAKLVSRGRNHKHQQQQKQQDLCQSFFFGDE